MTETDEKKESTNVGLEGKTVPIVQDKKRNEEVMRELKQIKENEQKRLHWYVEQTKKVNIEADYYESINRFQSEYEAFMGHTKLINEIKINAINEALKELGASEEDIIVVLKKLNLYEERTVPGSDQKAE